MFDFLNLTLEGTAPVQTKGKNEHLRWQWYDEGILAMTPYQETKKSLVLSAGIHGNETAPIEIVSNLVDVLLSGKMPLHWRLLVIFGNPAALRADKRYLQHDINRMFGGRWQTFPEDAETQRACLLEHTLEFFWSLDKHSTRWHLDLHTAIRDSYHPRFGVLPAQATPYDKKFLTWLTHAGLEALVFHQQPGGTFSHFSSEHFNAQSCTLELGKVHPMGNNDLRQFTATVQALSALISGGKFSELQREPLNYKVVQQITRQTEAFTLYVDEKAKNFSSFPKGTLLAQDGAVDYVVKGEQEFILFPNPSVALGLRAGLMLRKI